MNNRNLKRQLEAIDKELKTLHGGMDVAFDMAMNDRGASLARLQKKIDDLYEQRKQIVEQLRSEGG